MAPDDDHRHVTLQRLDTGVYRATNARGGTLDFGSRAGDGFTPVELLLAALAGCSAVDVDVVTGRRSAPEQFEVDADATYVRDEAGNRLTDLALTFRVTFPDGPDGDRAREMLPRAARTSHDRTCTVSRTIEAGSPVAVVIAEPGGRAAG
jgi:putative redox protein